MDLTLSGTRKNEILPVAFKMKAMEHIEQYSVHTVAYTDGSKSESGAGCAFVCGDAVRCFTLPKHASVFTCELVAILKLLCFIEIKPARSYLVLSDSLSGLQSFTQFYPPDPLVQDILLRLTALAREGTTVTFCWIPSHVGIAGNERADRAANHAAQQPCSRRFPLPARDFMASCELLLPREVAGGRAVNPADNTERLAVPHELQHLAQRIV